MRRRSTRIAIGAASVAGFTLVGAAPAFAAPDGVCTESNTVTAPQSAGDIQALLDVDTAIICISGTFDVDSTLLFDHDLTLYGLGAAVLDGGGDTQILYATTSDASVTVQDLAFNNGFTPGNGGAISAYDVTAIDSTFTGNTASSFGGAIWAYDVVSDSSTFTENTAGLGGAIFSYESALVIESTFNTNEGISYGGAISSYNIVDVVASTFEGNFAGGGGAIANEGAVDIVNSTFVGNQATESTAGAIATSSGTVLQSTFLDNTAPDDAGQSIHAWGEDDGIDLRANIFASSSTQEHLLVDSGATVDDLGGNRFSTVAEPELSGLQTSTAFGIPTALFFDGATLADNGGPTETVALFDGSAALDAVPDGLPFVPVDQRGVDRVAPSDAGAYEFVAALAPVTPPALAATGSTSAGWAAGAGAVLLAAGAVVLAAVRRRNA